MTTNEYILAHSIKTRDGARIVSDRYETPRRIRRSLIHRYGQPRVSGETGWWEIADYATIEREAA